MRTLEKPNNISNSESSIRSVYKIGAAAAFLAAIIFRRNWSAEADLLLPVDMPVTVLEWFNLFHENSLLGLIMMDFFDMVNYALVGVIFFTLYYALRDTNEIYMRFAIIISSVGVAVYFASNHAFTMLSLSDRYFAASAADKSIFLSAGEAVLAIHQGSGSYASLFLIGLSGLIISIIMLQNNVFSRITAYFGVLANGVLLSYFITIIVLPTIGWFPIPLSAIPLMIWYILVGVKLYKLSKD